MTKATELRIRALNGAPHAWIALQGTILTYHERFWSREAYIDIPIELVRIASSKKLWGARLIMALLSLLLGPAIGGATLGILHLVHGPVPEAVMSTCMASGALIGLTLFIIMLVLFFRKVPTVTLSVPHDFRVEFWLHGKNKSDLAQMISELQRRQNLIAETLPHPLRSGAADVVTHPWKQTIATTALAAIPGIMTEIPWLLFLCVVPPTLHIYRSLRDLSTPRLFRQAVKQYMQQRWSEAMATARQLIAEQPDFIPAKLIYLDLLGKDGRFDESADLVSELQGKVEPDALQTIQADLILRERIWKRKREHPT